MYTWMSGSVWKRKRNPGNEPVSERQRESVDSNSRQIYRPTVVYVHTKLNEVCSKHKPVSLPNQLSSPSARRNTQRVTGRRKGNKLGSNHRKSREWTQERGALYKASPTLLSGPLMWQMSKQDGCKSTNQSAIWAAKAAEAMHTKTVGWRL